MDYALLFSAMGVAILYLYYRNFVTQRELNRTKAIAALLIAEKMGLKLNGQDVKVEFEEMKEKKV